MCYIEPLADTNPPGTLHEFTVHVRNIDGSAAAGLTVLVEIIAGPHKGFRGSAVTGADGTVDVPFPGVAGRTGRDTIRASGGSGVGAFDCTATKYWGNPPPPCTVEPIRDTDLVGDTHTITATFRTADAQPSLGTFVEISVTGVNDPLLAYAVTNSAGQVVFTYDGTKAGADTVTFAGSIDGVGVTCSATKTWVSSPPTCTIDPASAVNPVGTSHTMTVRVRNGDGSAASGVAVGLSVISGPNAGTNRSGSTDASGNVSLRYTGGSSTGTDSLHAGGLIGSLAFACDATKTWQPPATATWTATRTFTQTRTWTPTLTLTRTRTATGTRTPTPTPTWTRTGTSTRTPSRTRTATVTRTSSSTRTPSQTPMGVPTATGTPTTSPTRTVTATATPTPTPTPPLCEGACTVAGAVTVDDILKLVNLFLNHAEPDSCPGGHRKGQPVTTEDLIVAVDNLLVGCPKE